VRVIVVVPSAESADRPAVELAAEVRQHLRVEPGFVWGGDPQLRPAAPGPGGWLEAGPRWFAADDGVDGVPAGLARAASSPRLVGLVHALAVAARDRDDEVVLFLDAIRAVLLGSLDVPTDAVGTIDRGVPAVDGLAPTVADLAEHGPHGLAALSMRSGVAARIGRRLLDGGPDGRPGRLLAAALAGQPVRPLPGEVVGWSAADAAPASVLDTEHVDRAEPWHVAFDDTPRVLLSERPDLLELLRAPAEPGPLAVPGGIEVDGTIRRLVASHLREHLRSGTPPAPDPWVEPSRFVAWLATPANPWDPAIGRYWNTLWKDRADLQTAFPDPAGDDLAEFRRWADRRHEWEPHSPLLPSHRPAAEPWRDDGRAAGGVDLVGYFGAEVSLASVTERIRAGLDAVGIPYRTVDFRRTGSPRRDGVRTDDALAHDTVVVVANPDQVPALLAEHGSVLAGRRLVGFWHWDVEHVPDRVVREMRHFDQIWVLDEFTERSLAAASPSTPVRSLPLPVARPMPSAASREQLGLPTDRQVVLVTFDHLSLTERKNPVGAIEAFRRAVPEPVDGGPVLVVKSMNAALRWSEHERVRLAAHGRADILVVDTVLSMPDQWALIAHADVLLSLHRSEGLGLHLVEAMWLGTPTIATRYSGNLSFMDDDNSLLVDADLVPAERTEGFFPAEARWADPDLDQAAGHLRRLLTDEALRDRLASRGRARMERQPSFAETGRTIAAWCGIEVR
jgi:glycosyltransferase involved in cell wall biosynthesis